MKKIFYAGLAGLALFEILNVYFIMPLPGSQRMNSLGVAYTLHAWRWVFRALFLLAIVAAGKAAFRIRHKWLPILPVVLTGAVVWFFNFTMTADRMFRQPATLVLKARAANAVDESSIVVGVERNGEAKAYPLRFLVYHHQVQDTVGGTPVIVTYCSVCRSGRVFEPLVDGRHETFRLVGMDHFNAMFEDATTGSWWRQATGKAVAGRLKGTALPVMPSNQLTLGRWFELHPSAVVMQADDASAAGYDTNGRFERGESKGDLTRTDPASWQEKSWVVGVEIGQVSRAYDWNRLKAQRIINDTVDAQPIVLALASDEQSFVAFERPREAEVFTIENDVLSSAGRSYDFSGRDLATPGQRLKMVEASQAFWHSWRTFHPGTEQHREETAGALRTR
jgi:hypothetical protein